MGAKIFIIVTIYKGYKPIQTLNFFFKKNIPKDTKDLKILHVYGVLLASINSHNLNYTQAALIHCT